MKMHQLSPAITTLKNCYERVAVRENEVGAFQYLKPIAQAIAECEKGPKGLLSGMPIGIKDIFDTTDMPTQWGTSYLYSPKSQADASLVASLRKAGAILIGKTVSTELAYFTPGKTRNPHDLKRTPGASSSGSAAAVADGMSRAAIGSQTAGSIIRPASFCGVVGFKPSADLIPSSGVKAFSKSLDTVGWFTRNIHDCALLFDAATQRQHNTDLPKSALATLRVNALIEIENIPLDNDVRALLKKSFYTLKKATARTSVIQESQLFCKLINVQKCIMAYEASRTLVHEFQFYKNSMGKELVDIIQLGSAIDLPEYLDALAFRDHALHTLTHTFFNQADILIAPSTIGEATVGLNTTGDPIYCRPWTLLGLPCLHLPTGKGSHGMPIGIQLIGKPKEDLKLLSSALSIVQLEDFKLTCLTGEANEH